MTQPPPPAGDYWPPRGAPATPPPTEPPPPAPGPPPPAVVPGSPPPRPGLDDRERTLDPRVIRVWRLLTAVGIAAPTAVATLPALLVFGGLGWLVPAAGAVLLAAFAGWYPVVRYRRWRWRLTDIALELRHGVLVHRHEAVPYFRIQQIDVTQGPLDRLLDLATLQVTTASASGSAGLPGIAAGDAPTVRAELLARAAAAVAEHRSEISDAV